MNVVAGCVVVVRTVYACGGGGRSVGSWWFTQSFVVVILDYKFH